MTHRTKSHTVAWSTRERFKGDIMLETLPSSEAAARIRGGTKIYGEGDAEIRALDSISADFERGQFTAIMGPSGSGKSTLLHVLGTLDKPTKGIVKVASFTRSCLSNIGHCAVKVIFPLYPSTGHHGQTPAQQESRP